MNIPASGLFILLCSAAVAFACRGIVLLRMTKAIPGRVVSMSGAAAMIAVWALAGITPFVCAAFADIFREFDLQLPRATELTIAFFSLAFRYAVLWFPLAVSLSLCALTMPELFYLRPRRIGAAREADGYGNDDR